MANEGAVACALERYHLIHGEYPETLVPKFLDKGKSITEGDWVWGQSSDATLR